MLKNFRAFVLARDFYRECKWLRLPPHFRDQLLRSSSSIALNLAESAGNRTEKERLRAFTMALGSLRESQAILELENIEDAKIQDLANQLGAVLFKLCQIERIARQTEELAPYEQSAKPN